jgi:two-component system, NarL family, nitrate/nitrite response regulator NarL
MQVLLVDDHPIVCEVLQQVIKRALSPDGLLVEKDLASALSALRQAGSVDLALLDLGLPDCTGMEVVIRFRKSFSDVPVIVISAQEDRATIRAAMQLGARGYIPKTTAVDVMEAALKLVAAGGTYVPKELLAESADRNRAHNLGLTDRQRDVFKLLLQGHGNREIARHLSVAENTVKQHVRVIFQELGVASRMEAMVVAARRGLSFD